MRLTVKTETPSAFALRLRIPPWAGDVRVTLNGQPLDSVAGQHTCIEREWAEKTHLLQQIQGGQQIEFIDKEREPGNRASPPRLPSSKNSS